jgi:hypothetical protein
MTTAAKIGSMITIRMVICAIVLSNSRICISFVIATDTSSVAWYHYNDSFGALQLESAENRKYFRKIFICANPLV